MTAHQQLLAKSKQGRIDVYFEGDSIIRRWGLPIIPNCWRIGSAISSDGMPRISDGARTESKISCGVWKTANWMG
jgi:hypothetical protein